MSKKGKRNRSTPTKNNTGSPSTSPAQKAPRVEEPMATTSSGDQPDLAAIMAEVKRLQDQVKSMDGTVTQLRGEVADLKQAKETLETEVAAFKEENEKLEAENEKLRQAANRNRLVIKGVPADISNEAVKAKVLEVTEGLPQHSVLDIYQSGPCRIVVLDTLISAIRVLKAQSRLWRDTQWRMDRSLTKKQREARGAQTERFKALRQAGAFPRFHGTTLMVRMTSGVKPEAEWDPALKLPPRPAAPAGQQQGQQRQQDFAGAVRGGNRNGGGTSGTGHGQRRT